MEASISEQDPPRKPRGFAALHRDVWRIVRIAPVIFLALPAVVWLPIDALIEAVMASVELDEWRELRYSIQLAGLAQLLIGSLVAAIQLQALRLIADGQPVTFVEAARGGFRMWSRLIGVFFAVGWRTGIGFLLLVVPGLYLMVRYSLANPVAVFEGKRGKAALDASHEYVKGRGWRIFFFGLGALLLYFPIMMGPSLFLKVDASPLLLALTTVPANVAIHLIVVAMTLIYADRRKDWFPAAPIGQVVLATGLPIEPLKTGRRAVWLVGGLSYTSLIVSMVFLISGTDRIIAAADAAHEAGDYELARAKYEEAAEWIPDDPYLEYSLGWANYEIGDLRRARRHMARAVELAPDDPDCLTGLVTVLIDLEDFAEASAVVDRAESREGSDGFTIEYLRGAIRLSSEAEELATSE